MKKQFLSLFAALVICASVNTFAQGMQDFTLINATGVTIYHVYITPHNSTTWGSDVMGADVFMDGDEQPISFESQEDVCFWDIKVDDSEGNALKWLEGIDLCTYYTITLHYADGKGWATFE